MAGGLGGDDEDFDYNDGEELSELNESEEQLAEEQLAEQQSENEDDDEDDDSTDETAGMDPIEKKLFEIEEGRLEEKLKELPSKIHERGFWTPTILPWEKRNLDKARRHKKLKTLVKDVDSAVMLKKTEKRVRATHWLMTFLLSIFPILMIGLLIIIALGIILTLNPWQAKDEDGNIPQSASPEFGITGNDFYGIRSWYRDEDKSRNELTSEYVMLLSDSAGLIAGNHSIGEYNVTITITDEDYDVQKLAENTELSAYVSGVAKLMYSADNEGASAPEDLNTTLDGVKYFGFDESVLKSDYLKALVADYITSHYEFVANSSGASVDSATIKGDVDSWITEQINLDQDKYKVRTEKVFIKDYLINGDDKMVENVTRHDYIGMAFMAKRDVTFTQLSFTTAFIKDGFEMTMTKDGSNISLPKTEEMTSDDTGVKQYTYKTTISQSVTAYNYVALPENEISIFSLAGNDAYADLVVADESGIYAYNEGEGLVGHFNNPSHETFLCVEFDTLWR